MTTPFILKRQAFDKALGQLEAALKEPYSEFLRDAVTQRFEFTYELAWKTLKILLASLDIDVRSPKETLKEAFKQGFLEDAEAWGELHQKRNLTSHTYDEQLAEQVYQFVSSTGFVLFQTLQITLKQYS